MSLVHAVKSGWKYAGKANSHISAFPTFFVKEAIRRYDRHHETSLKHKLAKVNGSITSSTLIDPLIIELREYTCSEYGEATHRVKFNDALLGNDETRELHESDLPNRPENMIDNWARLSQYLAELRQHYGNVGFDGRVRQFYTSADTQPDLDTLIERANAQLRHAGDLSVIVDPTNSVNALADRSDFAAKKLVKPLIRKYRDELEQLIQNGFIVVGPRNITLYTPANGQGFKQFFDSFVNPTLEHLVIRQRNAIEEELEVAKAGAVAKGTIEGNILGWIDAFRYVVVPYVLLRSGIQAVQNSVGIDNVAADYALRSLGYLTDTSLLVGSFFFPSRGEVTGIASHANYEKIARQIEAYNVGRQGIVIDGVRYRDMTLYRNISASFTQEENMQVKGIEGWEKATWFTGIAAITGIITHPAVIALVSSLQVSNNNYFTNAVNFWSKHFEPLRRQRRRIYVAERPELVQYWGIECVVDPSAKNPEDDLRSINPRTLDYLVSENGNAGQQTSDVTVEVRRRIGEEVNQRVSRELAYFEGLPDEKKAQRIIWQYIKHRNNRILHLFSDRKSKSQDKKTVKVEKPKGYRRGVFFSDIPRALGSPFSLPGYSEWRVPEGSYFNRSFNLMNWLVPLTFAGGYYLLGTTKASPGEIVAVQINDYMDILYKAGIALLAAAGIALGAADTAGACLSSRAEVLFEQGRKGKEYLLGSHSKTVKNAIDGKNGAVVYEIPHTRAIHYDRVIDLLKPLSKKGKIPTKVLVDSDDTFNAQFTLNPNRLSKGNYVTAIRKPGEEFITLYVSKDLGQDLIRYRKEMSTK
ncbi:MAG: hypothetical protein HY361_04840 [Candidatus Aenigmarchaeota archaeon]|nr:hypothetical protein [Candidatus Aenigmarchaeota archaeon]